MRGKELTSEQRERIIGAYLSGIKQNVISTQLNIPTSTINDTIKRYKKTHTTTPKKRPGRPKTFTQRDTRALQRIIRSNRFASLSVLTSKVNSTLGTTLHNDTVRKYLHNEGFGSYATKKKPLLTEKQQAKRLRWCKQKRNWVEEWKRIVWSDESRFCLFKSDGRTRVWRNTEEAYRKDCIQHTVKFGGGSVMFWGCFSWDGIGPLVLVDGNMNSDDYVNVLANNFIPWVRNYPDAILQQDGAPCHTSAYSLWWLSTHNVRTLDWVAQSPDINPIENLWNHLDYQVRRRTPLPQTKEELVSAIQEEWSRISIDVLQRLVLSLPHHTNAIIKAKGGPTKY